jgi:hypothetical protein
MFKIALRISALLLIVIGSFYCGRATMFAKSESIIAENSPKFFQLSDYQIKTNKRAIDFQLEKTSPIFDSAKHDFQIDTTAPQNKMCIPNSPDMRYPLEWDEENKCFLYQGNKFEEIRETFEQFIFISGWER